MTSDPRTSLFRIWPGEPANSPTSKPPPSPYVETSNFRSTIIDTPAGAPNIYTTTGDQTPANSTTPSCSPTGAPNSGTFTPTIDWSPASENNPLPKNGVTDSQSRPADPTTFDGGCDKYPKQTHLCNRELGPKASPDTKQPTISKHRATIGSINIQNVKTNKAFLQSVFGKLDIICIQEHWLFDFEHSLLQEMSDQHLVFSKCVDMNDPLPPNERIRGYGGVATFRSLQVSR